MVKADRAILIALAVLVLAAKAPTLDTPYHWDETLWISFAHRVAAGPLWHVLPGLHPATLFGGRPPGLFLPVAALIQLTGPSIWGSHLMIAAFAVVGVAFTYRLGALLYGTTAGVFAALFLFLNAMYFAQAGMFLADLPVAACGVACVYWALRRRYAPYLAFAFGLVLLKETALAVVVAVSVSVLIAERGRGVVGALRAALPWTVPMLAMGIYYTAQKVFTGSFFVTYAEPFDILQPGLALAQVRTVTRWLFVEQLRWIFTALVAANLVLNRGARRRELLLFALIVAGSGYTFSLLYLLPRYLLPVAPYLYVAGAGALVELFPRPAVHRLLGAALIVALAVRLRQSDGGGNGEWDLQYLAAVRMHGETARHLAERHGGARVLTAWPLSAYLTNPHFGYTTRPLRASHIRSVSDLEVTDGFDVAVACAPDDGLGARVAAYAHSHGLASVERIAVEPFFCDVYARPG